MKEEKPQQVIISFSIKHSHSLDAYVKASSNITSCWFTESLRDLKCNGRKTVKQTASMSKTTTLHMHHTLLYISLPFLHNYDFWMPNFTFYGEYKQAMMKFYSLNLNLDMVHKNSNPVGFTHIWQSKWVGITAVSWKGPKKWMHIHSRLTLRQQL